MKINLGVEDIEPNNWVAWVFELPGCYARASTHDGAVSAVPEALEEVLARLTQSGFHACDAYRRSEIVIEEEFRAVSSSPDYLVNAFFENDRIPLTEADIDFARHMLGLNRKDLLAIYAELSDETLKRPIPGEVQLNIGGILTHIGAAEWWYWDRLDMAFPRSERPAELNALLRKVREYTMRRLPELVGSSMTTIRMGETWSPRKLVRRAIWHERVHTLQIRRYLSAP